MSCFCRNLWFGIAVLCLVAVGSLSPVNRAAAEDATETEALDFVRKTGLNNNFPEMIMGFAVQTQTVQGLMIKYGSTPVTASLVNEVRQVVLEYGPAWDRNLASIYAEFYTREEMLSLLNDPLTSPYLPKLKQNNHEIGVKMQALSWDLMQESVVATVKAVFQEFSGTANQ